MIVEMEYVTDSADVHAVCTRVMTSSYLIRVVDECYTGNFCDVKMCEPGTPTRSSYSSLQRVSDIYHKCQTDMRDSSPPLLASSSSSSCSSVLSPQS